MSVAKLTRSPNLSSLVPMSIAEGKRIPDIILVEDNQDNVSTPKEGKEILHDLEVMVDSIGLIGEYRITQRKECQNLVRRIKILPLLLEEITEMNGPFSEAVVSSLKNLRKALSSAKKLLRTCAEGSKIYLALECEVVMGMFHSVNARLGQALEDIPYNDLSISDEVREQIELVSLQLKRAKRRTDTQDMELAMDMMVVFNKDNDDRNADIAMLERLAKKLDLHKVEDLEAETKAVRKLVKDKRAEEYIQLIVNVLNKFKQVVGVEETNLLEEPVQKPCESIKYPGVEIPQEFLCPISLEIMTDPVIVATGGNHLT